MGKHFDTLVELVRKLVRPDELPCSGGETFISRVKPYLESVIQRATLFELPLNSNELRPDTDNVIYGKYVRDYMELSKTYKKFMLAPFELTAIEDPTSVTILDNLDSNEYLITNCSLGNNVHPPAEVASLQCGRVKIDLPDDSGLIKTHNKVIYNLTRHNGSRLECPPEIHEGLLQGALLDLGNSAIAYVSELVYIMDPANFIIRKEHKESRKHTERRHNPNMLRKTVMRPHYICLGEKDTRTFISDQSKEPYPAHPVRGHWKTLMSERFIHKQGQRIFIRQYFTGQGRVDGIQGWSYEVMVKDAPDSIVAYSEEPKTITKPKD